MSDLPISEFLWRSMHQAGWLPDSVSWRDFSAFPDGTDFLHALGQIWGLADVPLTRRAARFYDWLRRVIDRGAVLKSVISPNDKSPDIDCLRDVLVWWPNGIPPGRLIGFVSSRIGRDPTRRRAWAQAFRQACQDIAQAQNWILAARGTAPFPLVDCWLRETHHNRLDIVTPRNEAGETLAQWLGNIYQNDRARHGPLDRIFEMNISPKVGPNRDQPDSQKDPVRDRVVVEISDQLHVLSVRPGGAVDRLVDRRLSNFGPEKSGTFVYVEPHLIGEPIVSRWQTLRAKFVGLTLPAIRLTTSFPDAPQSPVDLPSPNRWQFLTHCTRTTSGPWCDQSSDDYFHELIFGDEFADRSALATLIRILSSERLIASSRTIRGHYPVVSFTDIPLRNLSELNVFRPHRGTWDFEPYGICIARDWLVQRGARTVSYGDDLLWQRLNEQDRPFFQVKQSASRRRTPGIDWSIEHEWRHLGDVRLSELPSNAGYVFVKSLAEKPVVRAVSKWPVVSIEETVSTSS